MLPLTCLEFMIKVAAAVVAFLIVTHVVLWLISVIWSRVWAWIDETEAESSFYWKFVLKSLGYRKTLRWSCFSYEDRHGEGSKGWLPFFLPIRLSLSIFLIPIIIWLYSVSIAVATLIGLAFMARFGRRLYKKFIKHEKNKDAHK